MSTRSQETLLCHGNTASSWNPNFSPGGGGYTRFWERGVFFGGLMNSHKKLPAGQQSDIRMASAALCANG